MRHRDQRRLALLLCFLFLSGSVSGCRRKQTNAASFRKNDSVAATADALGVYGFLDVEGMSLLGTADGVSLLFDDSAAGVALRDEHTQTLWSSLPVAGMIPGCAFIATVAGENGRYYLNTQDHAAAFGSVSAQTWDSGVSVAYTLSDDPAVAQKARESLSAGDLQVSFTANFTLRNGDLLLEIDAGGIFVSDGYVLEKLSVLPYLGAIHYGAAEAEPAPQEAQIPASEEDGPAQETEVSAAVLPTDGQYDDFILLPDGCGAAVYTRFTDPANADLTFRVSPQAGDGVHSASLGVFGIKKGETAMVCTVTQGLAVADIRSVQFASDAERLCTAFAEFRITQTQTDGDLYYYGLPYRGTIRLAYQFLYGDMATYVSMADVARETMVRAGLLREQKLSLEDVPLAVSLLCSADGSRDSVYTTFQQAEDLLNQLKAKGIDAAYVVLQGAFSGGILQNTQDRLRPNRRLGGEEDFDSLCAYAKKQNFRLCAGVNLLYAKESAAAKKLNGDITKIYASLGSFSSVWREKNASVTALVAAGNIEKQAVKILKYLRDNPLAGICLNDAAGTQYYDCGAKIGQSDVASIVCDQLGAFGGAGTLVMNGVNGAMLKDADLLLQVPFNTGVAVSDSYAAVPLLPSLLHGCTLYAGTAINADAVPHLAFLKCVEYGGVPYYEWYHGGNNALSFENGVSEAAEYTQKLNETLGDLVGVRISGHCRIADGVYRTDYENGAVIFVNYNNFSVNVSSITIPPYDYLRMN